MFFERLLQLPKIDKLNVEVCIKIQSKLRINKIEFVQMRSYIITQFELINSISKDILKFSL
jgi:hypothetical protein